MDSPKKKVTGDDYDEPTKKRRNLGQIAPVWSNKKTRAGKGQSDPEGKTPKNINNKW